MSVSNWPLLSPYPLYLTEYFLLISPRLPPSLQYMPTFISCYFVTCLFSKIAAPHFIHAIFPFCMLSLSVLHSCFLYSIHLSFNLTCHTSVYYTYMYLHIGPTLRRVPSCTLSSFYLRSFLPVNPAIHHFKLFIFPHSSLSSFWSFLYDRLVTSPIYCKHPPSSHQSPKNL